MQNNGHGSGATMPLLRARPPAAIVRPVSQTAFYIEGPDAFQRATREVVDWMRVRCTDIPDSATRGELFRVGAGGAYSAEAIGLQTDEVHLWSAVLEDHRESANGRTWVTEVTIGQREQLAAFGARLSLVVRGGDAPFYPSRPNCVYQVLQHVTAKIDGLEVRNDVHEVNTVAETRDFIAFLSQRDRRLPVVAMSITNDGKSSIDIDAACRRLSGLAHFFALSPSASWTVTEDLTQSFSVFNGATRLYRPAFDPANGNPFDHPLWRMRTNVREEKTALLAQISSHVAAASIRAFSGGIDFPRYDDVRRAAAEQAVVARKSAGADASELLQLYVDENDKLRDQLEALRSEHDTELQFASDELTRAEAARDEAVAERRALRIRITALETSLKQRGWPQTDQPLGGFSDIENWTVTHLAGSIGIAPKAIRETEKHGEFEDVKLFGDTLLTLRDHFVPMKRNPGAERRAAYEARLRELRLTDMPCFGQRGAIKDFPEYRVDYEGEQLWCEDHIKFGGGKDPRKLFRIYYCWHEEDQILLIGHMPTHLDNMRTD